MVTVDEAMRKGQRLINLPILVFMIAGLSGFVYLDSKNLVPSPVALVGMMIVFLASWLYWSLAITKWRLWAFTQVDDPFELRRRGCRKTTLAERKHF